MRVTIRLREKEGTSGRVIILNGAEASRFNEEYTLYSNSRSISSGVYQGSDVGESEVKSVEIAFADVVMIL